jgi:lantibiotic biosynthesis protein
MMPLHDDLFAVLEAVEIRSLSCFSVLGQRREVVDDGSIGSTSQPDASQRVAVLSECLYESLYLRPTAIVRSSRVDSFSRDDFVASLSALNSGQGTWEPGWRIRGIDRDGRVRVSKSGVEFWVAARGLRARGDVIRPGESCQVWVAKERRALMPGFYFALGDGDQHEYDEGIQPLLRYYWHLTLPAAESFLGATSALFNEARIPFEAKVLSDPETYRRADAGVLYIKQPYHKKIARLIDQIYSVVAPGLRPDSPLFTKRLANGLGFAVGPVGRQSFGQHRCHLIASALWESFQRGETDRTLQARAIAEAFMREGLDPLRPYLGPSCDEEWQPQPLTFMSGLAERTRKSGLQESVGRSLRVPRPMSQLEAAAQIGRSLSRTAYWDDRRGRCNWIGRSSSERQTYGGPISPTASALGPEFYAGSAGVALFLARLFAMTGDEDARRAALGAIGCSITQLDRIRVAEPIARLSFHSGQIGVAFAAREVGTLIGQIEVNAQSRSILNSVLEADDVPRALDVLSGIAGAVPALLALARESDLERCRDLAMSLGEVLCRRGMHQERACSWQPDSISSSTTAAPPLTGLSHGAAGIGLALFELYAATGRHDLLETARGAFAYEDSLFDSQRRNWPDLRPNGRSGPPEPGAEFAVAWCHGAPGIALTRLRAAQLDPERKDDYLRSARAGIATTLEAIDQHIDDPRADATLCHGLTGLIDIVWTAGRMLDDASYRDRALAAAEVLIARHSASDDWPSGAPSGGPNPSLMIGTAGIGYTFLRLHAPDHVPSVLWIGL